MYNKNGVSLIELLMVLAILGILWTIAVPVLGGTNNGISSFNLEISSRQLLSDMRLAQQKAMSEGCIYHIFFDNSKNSYMIYSYNDMNSCVLKEAALPLGISFDRSRSTYKDNKVSFNSRGKPLPYPCTVALKNSAGDYRRITITVGTDYISLKKD